MKTILANLALFAAACLVILIPSILNGYPILFSDTGTYILSGMEAMVPIDRPVFYGYFIRLTSFWISLWYVVIFQAVFIILFIAMIFRYVFESRYVLLNTFAVVAILSGTSSLAYFTNHIVPDIFASMVIIGVVLIVATPRLPIWLTVSLLLILSVFNLVHLSNLLITTSLTVVAIAGGILFFRKQWFKQRARAILYLCVLTISSWILLPAVNHMLGAGFASSRVKNIFMMGSLIENGLMKLYLEESCAEKGYDLCNYLDSLPEYTHLFLWDNRSPLYAGGCLEKDWLDCWLEKDPEYGIIIKDMFSQRKYFIRFAGFGIKTSLQQLVSYKIQPRRPEGEGSPVRWPMEKHFKRDYQRYISAKQQQQELSWPVLSVTQRIIVPIALAFLLPFLLMPSLRNKIPVNVRIFTLGILLALVGNAFICAVFSHYNHRYQSRVIWIIPMLALSYLIHFTAVFRGKLLTRRTHSPSGDLNT